MDGNPYMPWQVNLPLFFGKDRQKLVRDISGDLVTYSESCALVGGQRMGKSTLLFKIKEALALKNTVQCFYVDVQSRTELNSSNDAFAWLGSHAGIDNAGYQDFGRSLKTKWIKKGKCSKVIFLIDEFDAFGNYDWHRHFFDNLRSLLASNQEIRDCIAVVVSGSRRLESLLLGGAGSPLGTFLSWHYLLLLDEEDSCRLISEPTDDAIPRGIQTLLFEKTGGQPYFIQYLMSKIFNRDPDQLRPTLDRSEREFVSKHEGTFKLWWENHLDDNDRHVFSLLLNTGALSKSDIKEKLPAIPINKSLKVLSYSGFIRFARDNKYDVSGSILRKWVAENI